MISTFDLMLLGSLVSAGGLLFLRHGKRSYLNWSSLGMAKRPCELSAESRQQHASARASPTSSPHTPRPATQKPASEVFSTLITSRFR